MAIESEKINAASYSTLPPDLNCHTWCWSQWRMEDFLQEEKVKWRKGEALPDSLSGLPTFIPIKHHFLSCPKLGCWHRNGSYEQNHLLLVGITYKELLQPQCFVVDFFKTCPDHHSTTLNPPLVCWSLRLLYSSPFILVLLFWIAATKIKACLDIIFFFGLTLLK